MGIPTGFDGLGVFYLGTAIDPRSGARGEAVLYPSRHLTTHAVCVGMTGSGKTGLLLALLEEAALDGVPAIVVDPKGDLANLLLTFPDLAAADFEPWVDEGAARRAGLERAAFAANEAGKWRQGLAGSGQDGARIRAMRDSVELALYTPGSAAGRPLAVLGALEPPPGDDPDVLRQRMGTTASSLLALAGLDADPRRREHVLISSVLAASWATGRTLDLPALIAAVQAPPFARVGVLDLESFYPAKDRFELVLALNNLIAAPGFDAWMQGEPLDPGRLLTSPSGKPRISILSVSHLSESERMFFVSLLLDRMLGWTRAQPGTSSLRALLVMDEIAGYFPPVAQPPSKAPMLTLLKQARAFGVGVVLATQNPVDLDYKGLANTGTWLVGRLQTERDRSKVMEGLEGAGGSWDRSGLEALLAGLGNRRFLLADAHEDAPLLFESRFAMSYLRGPLGRDEVLRLVQRPAAAPAAASAPPVTSGETVRPAIPPAVPQLFAPPVAPGPPTYVPHALAAVTLAYADAKRGVQATQEVVLAAPLGDGPVPVDWSRAQELATPLAAMESAPREGARFAAPPAAAARERTYEDAGKDVLAQLGASRPLVLFQSGKLLSRPGESEADFRGRLALVAREQRDAALEAVRKRYEAKLAAIETRVVRAQEAVSREQAQASQAQMQTAISVGATVLGALFGRRAVSMGSVGRATTAARGVGRSLKEREDAAQATARLAELQADLAALQAEMKAALDDATAASEPATAPLQTVEILPARGRSVVRFAGLGWLA